MSKRALGRGIDALFQTGEVEIEKPAQGVEAISLDKISPNPDQPRKEFSEEALNELAASIKSKGIIQPVLVEPFGAGHYRIVAGERRYRAAKLAGLSVIPVIVRSFSELEKLEIALIENIQREDLTPIEEARAYRHLMELSGCGQEELSERMGKNRSTVANSLRLLKLPEDMQDSLGTREITPGHARAILMVNNPADQRILFNRIKTAGLSVREAEQAAADINKGIRASGKTHGSERPEKPVIPEIADLEEKLLTRFGTKVHISGTLKSGKIEIHYYSSDDLERVMELFEGMGP